jgi:hypothetical protein
MTNLQPLNQDFPLPYNAYAAFDATSLKSLMQQRLIENGTFTDQIFEGSNFNNLLDVIAYSYNVLLFYLNQTSNESLFDSATLYENMNKIVKLIKYNPIGTQTSVLNYNATANENLLTGVYTIPRYSYFTINDIVYSFNSDLTFIKSTTGVETISELSDYSLLYQGQFIEYPIYISTGEPFEEIPIISVSSDNENDPIDHHNIFVYVRDGSGKWRQWKRVENIFLENGSIECFEVRYNENQRYVIKIGNDVTGKKLVAGNLVCIYYLRTDKALGQIGAGSLDGNQIFFYNTDTYNIIMKDVRPVSTKLITFQEANNITFTNNTASTIYGEAENVKQIRQSSTNFFKRQGRLVTKEDFTSYILDNFSNLVKSVRVVDNNEYMDGHFRYFYDLGLKYPSLDSRVLYNQINFSDSCNFNNLYVYCVPKTLVNNSFNFNNAYLGLGLKDYIRNTIEPLKIVTTEVVFQDPVYFAISLGAATQFEILNDNLTTEIANETILRVEISDNNEISDSEIKNKIYNVFVNHFSFANTQLGQLIDIDSLTRQLYEITGVKNINTIRGNIVTPGVSLLGFNPVYSENKEDISIITQNIRLPYYKIPYLFNIEIFSNQIVITNQPLT